MREIKFRTWDKTTLTMRYMNHPHWALQANVSGNMTVYNLQDGSGGNEYILMQYTGLKDKNGKEIYEGDIVDVWYPDVQSPHHIDNIIYRETAACFDTNFVDDFVRAEIEVIGNVHESKYLLDKQ